ncbi:flagellar hook-associated protein FlgL [Psychrobium sp. MM17-31]|uniref:flagellar hook-associated protein FlgL n=1 Tax=Psychrobium sp. MM17-31 TaxID=2917758 RepID=UPI001EF63A6A|nr:flagellar hook-associated protein FlgL [Psychrobium sp. MM17-31]MCG7530124.1 flagellar hook-associated protein FlgL [Psychrobium sp. MM17-31]
MRISTNQFYHRNTTNIIERQSSVNQSILNISEGKRVITAGDDAVATNSILNIRQEQALLKQYQTNIDFADSRINVQESAMKSAEDVMFRVKDLIIQGNSIGNDDAARQAIADELKERKEELLSLANSRDESGSYVFGGFKTQNPPFEQQSDNSVMYHGDNGQRETNIGPGVRVATSDSGEKIFMEVASSTGDFRPTYNLNAGIDNVDRARISDASISSRANYVPVGNPDNYTINFATMPSGEMGVTVLDSTGAQQYPTPPTAAAPYVAGGTVSFNGVSVKMEETPQDGDSISLTPQKDVDMFSVIQDAIDWLEKPNGVGVDEAQRQLEIGHILGDVDQIQIELGGIRAEIGARLQVTESQDKRHEDYNLTIEKSRSALEDLDMVEAISQFEQRKISLQAAQTAFSQVQNMNLLNFL